MLCKYLLEIPIAILENTNFFAYITSVMLDMNNNNDIDYRGHHSLKWDLSHNLIMVLSSHVKLKKLEFESTTNVLD